MRQDMGEILITPGRRGSKDDKNESVRKLRKSSVDEDLPYRSSIRPKNSSGWDGRKIDCKGDYLTPLKRFLESRVGDKWDNIYSEIKRFCPSSSTVGDHIYLHLWGFVEKDITMIEGHPHRNIRTRWNNGALRKGDLYIYNGILCKVTKDKKPKVQQEKKIVIYMIDKTTFAVMNKKGVWFLFKYSNRRKTIKGMREEYDPIHSTRDARVYKTVAYERSEPYYKQIHLQSEDWDLIPYGDKYNDVLFGKAAYNQPEGQYYYLISCKTLNEKQKRELGL